MKYHRLRIASLIMAMAVLVGSIPLGGILSALGADDDQRVNLALGANVQVNSVWDDPEGYWRTQFLTDGSFMSDWPLPAGQTLGWRSARHDTRDASIEVTVDLGSPALVDTVVLYPRGNGGICFPDDYTVSVSADGTTWNEVASVVGDTEVAARGRSHSFSPTDARYVKIRITKLSAEKDGNDQVCILSEIEVFGTYTRSVTLSKTDLWLDVGGQEKLNPTLNGAADVEATSFVYEVENQSVATVSADGTVTAVQEGETTVTVTETHTNMKATCRVTVAKKAYDNIMITVPVWGNELAITEEQFLLLREADINGVMAVGHDNSAANADRMLAIAQNIWDSDRDWNLGVFVHSYLNGITPSSSDEDIIAHANEYRNRLAFLGYHIEDEPFDPLPYARIERLLRQNDPDSITDINFLPGMAYGSYDEYYARLSDYAKLLGSEKSYLSFDNYPFGPTPGSVDEGALFGNFETLRRAGLNNDVPTAFYLQGIGSEYYGYRRPDEGVLRYHIAAGLSYGFKWIKYFSWYVPGATGTGESDLYMDGIMDHDARTTELYDVAAALHREVHNVGDILVELDAVEVYHSGKKSTNSAYTTLPESFFVSQVGDAYAIVTLFVHPETGKQYLMIVNKDFEQEATLSFRLDGVSQLTEIDKTREDGTLEPQFESGVLTRTFAPGEFALYELPEGDFRSEKVVPNADNLLIGATSTASHTTTGQGWCIEYAYDGTLLSTNTHMGWKAESSTPIEPSITFDLGSSREMNRLDVYPAGMGESSGFMFPTSFILEVSEDGKTWTTVHTETDIPTPTTAVPTYTFNTAKGRYVRLTFGKTLAMAVSELALYMDDGSVPAPPATDYQKPVIREGENLAAGKSVIASTSYVDGAWNPAFVTDGIKMTSWPTDQTLGWRTPAYDTREVSELYLTVNLGLACPINRVILYPRGNGGICFPSDYTIEVSLDGVNWDTVYTAKDGKNEGETARIMDFDPITAVYVRLNVTRLSADLDGRDIACEISEFEIYGVPTPEEPDTDPIEPDTDPNEPDTDPIDPDTDPTDPVTDPITDGATDPVTDPESSGETDSAAAPAGPDGGCSSLLQSGWMIFLLTLLSGLMLRKRKRLLR